MVVGRGLLIKGLGVCALCAGGTAVALKWRDIGRLVSSEKKRVWGGLECEEPSEEKGGECSIKTGEKIFVKKGESTSFEVSNLGEGKIKVYKVEKAEGDEGYSENFKFLIEDNDISGTVTSNKLEEFESYEIKLGSKEETDTNLREKYYLSRKTEAKKEIKNALGLSWDLPDSASQDQASITSEDLKKIKFSGGEASITGGTVTLTISKDSSKTDYPLGYKFSFKNTNNTADATLKIGDKTITLKKDSPVDFKIKKEGTSLSLEKAWTLEELAEKVGLVKESTGDYWDVGKSGINVKVDNTTKKEKIEKYSDSEGRIKVYEKESGHNEGLKFIIEKGELRLKEYDDQGSTKEFYLGQFQSFEIVKDGDGKWYLSRKDDALEKLKKDLGLPCEFPKGTETSKECDLTSENIKSIKFDGKGNTDTTLSGSPKLTISKESTRYDYPLGYKFVFSSTGESTITIPSATPSSITLKNGLSVDYKIKRTGENNQTITLEKAWTPESLMKVGAGFADGNKSNGWNEAGEYGISVKQDSQKDTDLKISSSNSAKIKVYEGEAGYSQGYKFMVEEGDMNLSDGNSISKLSKYETYEVSKTSEDGNYYFTRKKKSEESIRELLGIPDTCAMPTTTDCDIDSSALNKIKFEGKGTTQATITDGGSSVKLKISKEKDAKEFPLGYKFTFSSTEHGFTVPLTTPSSSTLTVKKNTNTEFKIKESGSTLTLEKVWDVNKLAGKLGLTQCGSEGGNNKCTLGEKINVWDEESKYVIDATVSEHTNKKLVYELDQDGYNQGIKFSVDGENDIDLTTTNATGSESKPDKINKKDNGNGPTYQIMEKTMGSSAKWYLVKK